MKKSITVILVFALIFSSMFSANAQAYSIVKNNDYQTGVEICQERAELFLQNIGHPTTVSNPIELNNVANEAEAILFSTSQNGYIIVNINDYSIPEFSLKNPSPFVNCANPIYNGPLEYYYEQNGEIRSLKDDTIVDIEQLNDYYTREKISNPQKYLTTLYSTYQASNARYAIVEEYLSCALKRWCVPGDNCGSIASAICMRYYYDNVDTAYADSSGLTQTALITKMQEFVGSGGTTHRQLINGLNDYFDSRNVDNTAIGTSLFSFSRVKRSILADRPIIIGTLDHPTFGDHWIIAHGYFESIVDGNYIIINNGWGSNDIWIEPDTSLLSDTIHFEN